MTVTELLACDWGGCSTCLSLPALSKTLDDTEVGPETSAARRLAASIPPLINALNSLLDPEAPFESGPEPSAARRLAAERGWTRKYHEGGDRLYAYDYCPQHSFPKPGDRG